MAKVYACALTDDSTDQNKPEGKYEIRLLSVDTIQPFRDNPFRPYEGDRLDEMIKVIKKNGILNIELFAT
ncbi:MAG: hypothetical protein IJ899_02125 [Blautia sp.]|nr:hypothetical protein [Blautia sp.]